MYKVSWYLELLTKILLNIGGHQTNQFLVLLSGSCRTESPIYWDYYRIICIYIHILAFGYSWLWNHHWLPITLKIKYELNMTCWLLLAPVCSSISYPFPFCIAHPSHMTSFLLFLKHVKLSTQVLCICCAFCLDCSSHGWLLFFKCQFRCQLLRNCQLPYLN